MLSQPHPTGHLAALLAQFPPQDLPAPAVPLHGSSYYTLGEKGRVTLPRDFREQLSRHDAEGEHVLMAPLTAGVLVLFASDRLPELAAGWMTDRSTALGLLGQTQRVAVQPIQPAASSVRVRVPWHLRRHANLLPGDEVVLVGLADGVILCRADRWWQELQVATAGLGGGQ